MGLFWTKSKRIPAPSDMENPIDGFLRFFGAMVIEIIGVKQVDDIIREKVGAGIFSVEPKHLSYALSEKPEKIEHIKQLIATLTEKMETDFGRVFAEKKIAHAFDAMKQNLPKEALPHIMDLIPATYLEDDRVIYLSREALEAKVKEKTKELRDINATLEKLVEERTQKLEALLVERDEQNKMLEKRSMELAQANEDLKQLDLIKSEFTSVAAHQLRTPLSAVKWTLDMVNRGDLGSILDEQRLYLSKAQESNNRVIGLVNDLLHIEKIQAGTYEYSWKENIQVENIIDSILFELQSLATKKSIAVKFDKGDVPKIQADPDKIRAVLQTLIENAIMYSNDTGEVHVTTKATKDGIAIAVHDEGIGIPKDQQSHIFERFARAKNAIRAVPDGFGLGLYISKNIINRHHGTIECVSEEGKGATFTVTLPLAQPKQEAKAPLAVPVSA